MSTRLDRGHGWVPDEAVIRSLDAEMRPLRRLLGSGRDIAPPTLPSRCTYVRGGPNGIGRLDEIIDQGQTNSCVGCAFGTAIWLRGTLLFGSVPARPSEKAIYDLGRLGGNEAALLEDHGVNPRAAIDGTSRYGFARRSDWPLVATDPELLRLCLRPDGSMERWINVKPTFDVFASAFDFRLTGYARADDGSPEEIQRELESALTQGEIPTFGMFTPDDYQHVRGDEIYEHSTTGSTAGYPGQMQAIGGYDEDSFHVISSWGREHGDRGIVRVSKKFVTSRFAFDRIVIVTVPVT